jgi:hypothetical protein
MDSRQCPCLRELLLQLQSALNDDSKEPLFREMFEIVAEYSKKDY